MELAKAYDPKEAEQNHYKRWEDSGFFAPEINQDPDAEPYSIVIPPPNVTGSLHMGHALQHTLMDALTRWKRMLGYRTLFLVGVAPFDRQKRADFEWLRLAEPATGTPITT